MRINDLSARSVAERETVSPVDNDCTCKIIARANVHFVRIIYLSVNLVRTLAYSQEAYELYINARNSRVRYTEFCSLSFLLYLQDFKCLQALFLLLHSLRASLSILLPSSLPLLPSCSFITLTFRVFICFQARLLPSCSFITKK